MNEEPKRKGIPPRAGLYLTVGIFVGVLLAGLAFAGLTLLGPASTLVYSATFNITATPLPPAAAQAASTRQPPTALPRLQLQPTVIASHLTALDVARTNDGTTFAVAIWGEVDLNGDGVNEMGSSIELRQQRDPNSLLSQARRLFTGASLIDTLVFSPDGSKLVAGSRDTDGNRAYIIDVATGEVLQSLAGQSVAAFSPDGALLALAGSSGGIRLLDAHTLAFREAIPIEHTTPIYSMAFAPNSRELAVGGILNDNGGRNGVHIYDLNNPDAAPESYGAEQRVTAIAWHPDADAQLLALAVAGNVLLVDRSDASFRLMPFDGRQVTAVDFSTTGAWLAAAGGDSGLGTGLINVWRWDSSSGQPMIDSTMPLTFTDHAHIVTGLVFIPDSSAQFLSVGRDGSVRLWDASQAQQLSQLQM
jgi:WD40 repeat protein